ncbi:hypothetical protein [Marilutibacter alkalisoli]|uniref:Phasin family protein n=1 Tax=Marilutibacter alkalisoli TaxID=2591633 RepID=A0A514BNM7_9GAMM|nr:hypothetical protein [Lysobacter alkalisoli]QDH68983.1 hypothetical protein FKV23_01860 [Lysobacter alkalisoli]
MAFWFKRRRKPGSGGDGTAGADAATASTVDATEGPTSPGSGATGAGKDNASEATSKPSANPPRSTFGRMTDRLMTQSVAARPDTSALNTQIVQAVQLSNAETVAYAPSQVAIGPNMMISQAAGLVAQSAAAYFDGVSKLALASQGVLLKDMTESLVNQQLEKAAEDAVGVLATDVMMGAAAAVAAAAGAMEAESASFAIDRIDQSIAKYADLLANRRGKS